MVTFVYGCLAYLAICVGCGVLVAGMDAVDRLAARRVKRRRARRCDPLRLDGRGDAVEQAPGDDELPTVDEAEVRSLLVEIYKAQTRARFKGIYGEDGQP